MTVIRDYEVPLISQVFPHPLMKPSFHTVLSFQRHPEISTLIFWDATVVTALGQWFQNLEYFEETSITFHFK